MARVPKVREAMPRHEDPPRRSRTSRIVIRETPDGLGIHNPARRNMPKVLFLLLWLGGWAAGEYFAITQMLYGGNIAGSIFLLFWLTIWTIAGAYCWWLVLWSLFGSERLFVTGGALVRSKGIGPFQRRSVFPVAGMTDLRIARHAGSDSSLVQTPAFEFSAAGRTVRFGCDLSLEEWSDALAALRRVLPATAFAAEAVKEES